MLLGAVVSGCASLPPSPQTCYPFRAAFEARMGQDEGLKSMAGALLLESSDRGLAQAYGPMGLASGTVRIADGRLSLEDVWGQSLGDSELPLRDLPGLLAGDLPRRGLISSRRQADGRRLRYVWGLIWLDAAGRPARIAVGSDTDLWLESAAGRLAVRGCVAGLDLELDLEVLEGGCWR
jgi:hypothetical protein